MRSSSWVTLIVTIRAIRKRRDHAVVWFFSCFALRFSFSDFRVSWRSLSSETCLPWRQLFLGCLLVEQRNDDERAGRSAPQPASSDGTHVLGFFALAARTYIELDSLALFQCLVASALNRREVHEHIVTLLRVR